MLKTVGENNRVATVRFGDGRRNEPVPLSDGLLTVKVLSRRCPP